MPISPVPNKSCEGLIIRIYAGKFCKIHCIFCYFSIEGLPKADPEYLERGFTCTSIMVWAFSLLILSNFLTIHIYSYQVGYMPKIWPEL